MSPELCDDHVAAICRVLNDQGVEFVIIGARLRVEGDPAGAAFGPHPAMLRDAEMMTLITEEGPLDLCFAPAGFPNGYVSLSEHASVIVVGVDVPVDGDDGLDVGVLVCEWSAESRSFVRAVGLRECDYPTLRDDARVAVVPPDFDAVFVMDRRDRAGRSDLPDLLRKSFNMGSLANHVSPPGHVLNLLSITEGACCHTRYP